MAQWRFGDSPEDGEAWMASPQVLHAYLDYQVPGAGVSLQWRRIMVVTTSWMERHLAGVASTASGEASRLLLPSLLVIPDGAPSDLRRFLQLAVDQGGLDQFSEPIPS